MSPTKRKVAVWKFASCDGCQLTLLDCEDELLAIAEAVEIAHFLEATSTSVAGPYDLSIVEGSVTTASDVERIHDIRAQSKLLISIGACATTGGIQALRNVADFEHYVATVYAHPEYIKSLATSTPIAEHVKVDFELRGCPINKVQLLNLISAYLLDRKPRIESSPVCIECKRRGIVCVVVAHGTPCLGPVTHAGCGALCPAVDRGCFGCFGPADTINTDSLVSRLRSFGVSETAVTNSFHTFNTAAPGFREVLVANSVEEQ
jgi:sulfhydrogenase subunit delta